MEEAEIKDPVIIFKIHKAYRPHLTDSGILEVTNHAWVLGERREKALYALATYHSKVVGVYTIVHWHKNEEEPNRWAFDGEPAPEPIRDRYLNHTVEKYTKGTYRELLYVNC